MTGRKIKPSKTGRSGRAKGNTYEPTDVTPADFFKAWSRKEREALIEVLIDTLDAEAGDADLEETGDVEPSLGSIEDHPNPYCDGYDLHGGRDQSDWATGNLDDREGDEHDGREPDDDEGGESEKEDNEPSLGWTATEAAFGSYVEINGCEDLEEQCEDEGDQSDSGIGGQDGLMDQCAGHRAVGGHWAGRTRYEPYVS